MFNASARKYSGINTSYQKLLHFWNNSYCDFPLVQILVAKIEDYKFECLGIGRIRVVKTIITENDHDYSRGLQSFPL